MPDRRAGRLPRRLADRRAFSLLRSGPAPPLPCCRATGSCRPGVHSYLRAVSKRRDATLTPTLIPPQLLPPTPPTPPPPKKRRHDAADARIQRLQVGGHAARQEAAQAEPAGQPAEGAHPYAGHGGPAPRPHHDHQGERAESGGRKNRSGSAPPPTRPVRARASGPARSLSLSSLPTRRNALLTRTKKHNTNNTHIKTHANRPKPRPSASTSTK